MTIDEMLSKASSVAIFGHVRPDGDCIGSCLGLYNYIVDNFPNIQVQVFAEAFPPSYNLLNGADQVLSEYDGRPVDLAFLMDTPSFERCGANGAKCLKTAKFTCNIDHHISNPLNLCSENFVEPQASSASEVLYFLLDSNKVSKNAANSMYLGIVHDTGAFKFSATSKRTMNAVGDFIDKGCDFAKIINDTYYTRSYKATLITGLAKEKCKLALNGKVVYSYITPDEMQRFDVTPMDLSSVVDSIREVSGTEVAIFLYPVNGQYKISLRSNYIVNVNKIAGTFGGGGHEKAAGASTDEHPEVVIPKILSLIEEALKN
ncbi:MAG: bifunctional oligoribonuclease/PAP phosphatase NrnA [Fibrobacter sp.]|nr:bifunctional oligoribonuclease/PAP phosphatase NrnA [Fibrobacter sp.]